MEWVLALNLCLPRTLSSVANGRRGFPLYRRLMNRQSQLLNSIGINKVAAIAILKLDPSDKMSGAWSPYKRYIVYPQVDSTAGMTQTYIVLPLNLYPVKSISY